MCVLRAGTETGLPHTARYISLNLRDFLKFLREIRELDVWLMLTGN